MNRNTDVLSLRPSILVDENRNPLVIETFQNEVLRPILKFQHDLLLTYFKNHTAGKNMPVSKQEWSTYLQTCFSKDVNLRYFYIGLIAGLFTTEEMEFYKQNSSEINKRILQMLIQRLIGAL
ncbi:MAG: glyoxalase [Bacteroidia bacterium]